MKNTVEIELPTELLIGLHTNAESFAHYLKEQAAISLFKEGKITSRMASSWFKISSSACLKKASDAGASLLQDFEDDYRRETLLIS